MVGLKHISQYKENSMNQEQFGNHWKHLQDPLQAKWDKITNEDLLQIDGNMVKFQEVLALRYGDAKDAVSTWANRRYSNISGHYEGYEFGLKGPELNAG
jgi:uncharacterized protein YjbJ (UPF0337 family)